MATVVLLLFVMVLCLSKGHIVGTCIEVYSQVFGNKGVGVLKHSRTTILQASGVHIPGTGDVSHVELLSCAPGETRLRFHLGKLTVGKVQFGGSEYSVLSVDGCAQAGRAGVPLLPEFRFDVAAGPGAVCEIESCSWDEIDAPPPLPSAGAYWRSFGFEGERVADGGIYDGGGVYPAETASVLADYRIRGVSGAGVLLRPVCYDFGRGVLRTAQCMDVCVRDASQGGAQELDANVSFAHVQSRLFVNAVGLSTSMASDANRIGRLLMVLPDEWIGSEQDFVSWKRKVGFDVDICRYPGDTGDGANALAEHIRKAYVESGITHLILCGDCTDVPPAYTSVNTQNPGVKEPTSDIRYAFLSGEDCVADVFISRIPAHSGEQLKGVLTKIVSYESNPPDADSWRSKPLIMCSSERSSSGIYKNISDYELLKGMYEGLGADGVYEYEKSRLLCDSTSTGNNVISVLNGNGSPLFCYLGHGKYNSYVISSKVRFSVSDATGLLNGLRLPFVVAPVCDSGNFANQNGDCLSEAFFLNGVYGENGAVAVFAATSQTLWNPPIKSILEFAEQLKKAYADERCLSAGELFQNSVLSGKALAESEHSSLVDSPGDYYACQMHLFGDCTMMPRLRTLRPAAVAASLEGDELTVNVKWTDDGQPVKGAYVTLFLDGQCIARMVCDADGDACANVCGVRGEVTVNVNDFSIRPYATKLEIDRERGLDSDGDGLVSNDELLAFLAHSESCAVCRNNVGDAIESWKNGGVSPEPREATGVNGKYFETTDYSINSYGSILAEMDEMAAQNCDICRVEYVGHSGEWREIRALCICAADEKDVPHLLVAAGENKDERNSAQIALHFARFLISDKELATRAAFHIVPLMNPDAWEGDASAVFGVDSQECASFLRWASCLEFAAALILNSGGCTVYCPMGALNEQAVNCREFTALRNAWTENCDLVGTPPDEQRRSPLLDLLCNDLETLSIEVNVGGQSRLAGKKLQSLCSICEKPFAAWCEVASTGFSLCMGPGFMRDEIFMPYTLGADGHERTAWLSGGRSRFMTLVPGEYEMTVKSAGLVAQTMRFTVKEYMTPLVLDVSCDGTAPVHGIALSPKRYVPGEECRLEADYSEFLGGTLIWNVGVPHGWNARAAADAFRIEADGSFSFLFLDAPSKGSLNSIVVPCSDDAETSKVVSRLLWKGKSSQLTRIWNCCERRVARYSVENGWNLIGSTLVAELPSEYRHWKFDYGFHECKSILPGNAYWLYSDKKTVLDITGWYSDDYVNTCKAGWRLISPLRHTRAKGECMEYSRESRCFRRVGDVLKPGNAYWLFGE